MNESSSKLSDLRDIVVPDAPGLWPFAPGLWFAIGFVALLLLGLAWWFIQQRRQTAYRRAGLTLLANASTVYEVSVILKRVALAVYPRELVAPLHGAAWARFLRFDTDVFESPDEPASNELRQRASQWIRQHRVERDAEC
ncbi:MAG: DUF4381 domain-containing protein [Coraliomargarita sp.]